MKAFWGMCVIVLIIWGCASDDGGTREEYSQDSETDSEKSDTGSPFDTDIVSDSDTESSEDTDTGPEVPRPFEDANGSFLDNNTNDDWGSEGVCPALEVFCNGACLSTVGDTQDNCTLLMSKTDETGPIALNSGAVYYLSALREVLKTDLTTLETTSVLSGLTFPRALTVSEDAVYAHSGWPGFEGIVSVGVNGENPTIVADFDDDIFAMAEGGDSLFFAGSFMDDTLNSIPKGGGAITPVWGEDWAVDEFTARGEFLYYVDYTNQGTALLRAPLTDLTAAAEEMFVAAPYLEDLCVSDAKAYVRLRDSSSQPYAIYALDLAAMESTRTEISGLKDLIACNDSYAVYRLNGEDTDETGEIFALSAEDTSSTVIGSMEKIGFGGAVADNTHLFAAVGNMSTGGIIRLAFP